jgi:hypothetical protein
VAVQDLLGDASQRRVVDQRQRVGAVPLHADDGDGAVGEDAADRSVRLEILEPGLRQIYGVLELSPSPGRIKKLVV